MEVRMKITIFYDVMSRSLVQIYGCVRRHAGKLLADTQCHNPFLSDQS